MFSTGKRKKKTSKEKKENREVDSEIFMCPKCTKSYKLKHSLFRHLRYECGKNPSYSCNACDKKFKYKYDLKVHQSFKHSIGEKKVKASRKNDSIMGDITNSEDSIC